LAVAGTGKREGKQDAARQWMGRSWITVGELGIDRCQVSLVIHSTYFGPPPTEAASQRATPIAGGHIERPVETSHNTIHRNSSTSHRRIFSTPAPNENTLVSDLGTGITGKAFSVSTQDVLRQSPSAVLPMCPGCRRPMVLKRQKRISFTDRIAEATYRCDTCDIETKRALKYP